MKTEKQLRRLAEKVRFANTSDETYNTLLGFIADDVLEHFTVDSVFHEQEFRATNELAKRIAEYIRTWRP